MRSLHCLFETTTTTTTAAAVNASADVDLMVGNQQKDTRGTRHINMNQWGRVWG
jgi:hypothetical protein